jgi:hypothetical protein
MATDFHGLPTRHLGNRYLDLEYLAEAGPRIVRLTLADAPGQNLLVEVPDLKLATPIGDFSLRGGHRLWHSPEVIPRTYLADDSGLIVEERTDGVRLAQPTETLSGIAKSIEIQLHANRPAVTLRHQLRNNGVWTVELAPWAITMLPLGGLAILPQTVGALHPSALQPNRQLVLWPYTSWSDSRLVLANDYVLIHAEPRSPACKVGYLNRQGWCAYLRQGVLFVKRFEPRPTATHADFGCNVEFYCGDRFIEMETIGPIARVEPGQTVEHAETWELHAGVEAAQTLDGVREIAQSLGP